MKTGAVIFQSFILAFAFYGSHAQEILKAKGIVVDGSNGLALSHARVESGISTVLSDREGYFAVSAREGDTLLITHVGYDELFVPIPGNTNDTVRIELQQNTHILKEVTVNALPSEDELKAKILETSVTPTREEENAQENLQNIRTLWALGYRPEMDAMQNFREAMKPPADATILSSKGGIVKAFRDLGNPPVVSLPKRRQYSRPMTSLSYFKPRTPATDSFQVDSLAYRFKIQDSRFSIQNSRFKIPD